MKAFKSALKEIFLPYDQKPSRIAALKKEELERQEEETRYQEEIKKIRLPKRDYEGSEEEAKMIEDAAIDFINKSYDWGKRMDKTERAVAAIVTGRSWELFNDRPMQWEIGVDVLLFRSNKRGWDKDKYALFYLTFHAKQGRIVAPKCPPFVSIGVGDCTEFWESNVPDDIIQLVQTYKDSL